MYMKALTEMYDLICEWFISHSVSSGSILAFIIATIRLFLRGERNFISILLESLLCALISIGVTYLITSLWTINTEISIFIGSMCGYLGVENVKYILKILLKQKLGIENNDADIKENKE